MEVWRLGTGVLETDGVRREGRRLLAGFLPLG
jgi:hypothetical protein